MRLVPDLPENLPVKWDGELVYWTQWEPLIKITHYPPAPCEKCGGRDYLEASGCLPIRRLEQQRPRLMATCCTCCDQVTVSQWVGDRLEEWVLDESDMGSEGSTPDTLW